MPSNLLRPIKELPDISFIENDSITDMMERLVSNYEKRYEELTGTSVSLSPSDPMRVALYAVALDLYQIEQHVDRAGKQDLLKYSYGEFLDNLAANRSVCRNQASEAFTTIRFTASEAKDYALAIPASTRCTNGNGVFFRTVEYAEIRPGELYADVESVCTVAGDIGNGFLPGQINYLVDPLPYIEKVANTTVSAGGAAVESDESLAERVYLAPSSYSTAGPKDAYTYHAKTYNAGIGSVMPMTPAPGEVEVYILMADGSMPEDELINGLQEYLSGDLYRPMTDKVTVKKPEPVSFDIDFTYYINRSDSAKAVMIQEAVNKAVDEYKSWQTLEIGRDINPDELIRLVKAAGAKRVDITSPTFTVVRQTQAAQLGTRTVSNGGLEDD